MRTLIQVACRHGSKCAARFLGVVLLFGAVTFVQAAEWGWRVESVTNPATGAQAPGPGTVFPTKEGVLAAARGMFPPNSSGIDYEWKIVSMTTTAVTYQYIYEPKEPDYGPWTYTLLSEGPSGWGPVDGPFASEGEALAAMEAYRTGDLVPGGPPCQPPNLVPIDGDWGPVLGFAFPYGNTREARRWDIEWTVCSNPTIFRVQISRERTITCSSEGARLYRLEPDAAPSVGRARVARVIG